MGALRRGPARPESEVPIWMLALLVAAGGAIGVPIRAVLESAFPAGAGQWPWTTFAINLVGSFALGVLLESLSLRGADQGLRKGLRLGFGTGVIGGFTTYSTFALEIDGLARGGALWLAAGYAVGSILLGLAAAGAGMLLAGAFRPRTTLDDDGPGEPA